MKRLLLSLMCGVLALSLCACNSGGAQRGDNPVPDKAQSLVSKSPVSSALSIRDENQRRKIAKAIFAKEAEWAAADRMTEAGFAGLYETGYIFFDIDLDGNKELLVQLGTTDKLNCETIVYRFDDEGKLTKVKKANDLSFSAENLTLWTDEEDNSFYLNHYTKISGKGSQEVWNKLIFDDGTLKETGLFYINYSQQIVSTAPVSSAAASGETASSTEVSSVAAASSEVNSAASPAVSSAAASEVSNQATSSAVSSAPQTVSVAEYHIVGNSKAVSKEEFDTAFNEFRGKLSQSNIKSTFIKSTEWSMYTDSQKENALLDLLN